MFACSLPTHRYPQRSNRKVALPRLVQTKLWNLLLCSVLTLT